MVALAHVSDKNTQLLEEHLIAVSGGAASLGCKLGLRSTAALIGLLHDVGKASPAFQSYIRSFLPGTENPRHDLRGKIDHSTAGAQVLLRRLSAVANTPGAQEFAQMLALCVASHHSGLIDCVTQDGIDNLTERLNKSESQAHAEESWQMAPEAVRARAEELFRDPALLSELQAKIMPMLQELPPGAREIGDRIQMQIGLLARLLFSCLIDADRTDTADSENPIAATHRQHGHYKSWDTLLARLHETLDGLPCSSEIEHLRRRISDDCFHAAARPTGAYTLTVPTGGGKTLSALRFALEHARTHSLDRVVFVGPFISIVDQNAAVARKALEPAGTLFASVVLEHHSNLITDANRDDWRRKVLTENWDAPVVFTTMAQVLESLFGDGTRSVRRLHALTRSVIVFDEAQTLPIRLVHLFNNAANLLTRHCGSTVLLCTATQPLLGTVDEDRGALRFSPQPELVDGQPKLFERLKRYAVRDETRRKGGWSRKQVAELACEQAQRYGSCLVVVNTKRDAREIFALCREELPVARLVHLSTHMCPAHRMESLDALRTWLRESDPASGAPVLCISTQLIEAGVDVDFATVIRDLAGLDSMTQAAGRCNREGRRPEGIITMVKLGDLPKSLEDIRKGREASERILGDWEADHPDEAFPLHAAEPMRQYFHQSFYNRQGEMSYRVTAKEAGRDTTLLSMLGANHIAIHQARENRQSIPRRLLVQSFSTAASCFRLMDETQGIIVPFRENGEELINLLLATYDLEAEWQLLREAQRYTISVYATELKRLQDRGAVYGRQGMFFLRPEFYDEHTGLREEAGLMEPISV